MVDLTTLEGMDTRGKVRAMCAKALRPDPTDATVPSVAAVCVYGDLVATAREVVGDRIHVAAVATAFPSGRSSLDVKLMDTRDAVAAGADEIDMVIDRGAFLSGDLALVHDEIVAVKEACGTAHLKVILGAASTSTASRACCRTARASSPSLETMDGGKPIKESRDVDVPLAAAHFFYHAGWADKLDYASPRAARRAARRRRPGHPVEFPAADAAWKIAPALACGNTVVLKPAETTRSPR
jgi:deoxyribose-phosphate aldolase